MKRLFLALCLAGIILSSHAENVIVDGIDYTVDSATATATVARQSNSNLATATIPEEIEYDGKSFAVVAIGDWAFYGCRSMTEVSIPATVKTSGSFAFASCNALTKVNIQSVESWCDITWKDGYSNPLLCGHTLYIDNKPVETLVIPEGIAAIKESAFNGGDFKSVTFNDQLTSIGNLAFYDCSGLVNVVLPESLTSLGTSAFANCGSLSSISLPSTLAEISGYCFENCTSLASIDIPASIRTIGADAFKGCEALEKVNIPDIASWCDLEMLSDASNPLMSARKLYVDGNLITSLVVPDGVNQIPDYRFYSLSDLSTVTFPKSLQSIGTNAFADCEALTDITFNPESSLKTIGESAFESCSSLKSATVPDAVTSIGKYAFYGCTDLENITLPTGLTVIADGVLGECSSLSKIELPEGVTKIGFGAFFECTSLAEVCIPDATASIGKSAFNGCTGLNSLTLGSGLTSISSFAFADCTVIDNIYSRALTPPIAQASSFSSYTPTLWVMDSAAEQYAAADVWKDFTDRRIMDGGVVIPTVNGDKEATYYRLDGTRVSDTDIAPGIYIRVVNGQSTKVLIR